MADLTLAQRLTFAVKWTAAHALYVTGLLQVWKHVRLRNRAVVLTYHRVLDEADLARTWSHPAIIVRRATFERHMALLKRHFHVLTLDQFADTLERDVPFDGPACLITFDDGWLDTFDQAGPVLEREGVPAVVFMPTHFISSGRDTFWQERLGALLHAVWARAQQDAAFRVTATGVLEPHGLSRVLGWPAATVRTAIRELVQARKAEDSTTGGSPIRAMEALLGSEAPGLGADAFMSWEQAREMAARGIVFGGHSVTHRFMTTLDAAELDAEVSGTKAVLERELGRADAFCYPNGKCNDAVIEAVRRHGFRLAFVTGRGLVGAGEPRYAIRRVNLHEDMSAWPALFLARLVGVL